MYSYLQRSCSCNSPGLSILMTSAPRSPSSMEANGPARILQHKDACSPSLTHREIHNNTICVRCINACSPTPHTWSCPALWCHAEVPLDDDSLHLLNWRLRRRLDATGPEQLQHDGLGLLRRVADRTKLKLHSLNYVRTYTQGSIL